MIGATPSDSDALLQMARDKSAAGRQALAATVAGLFLDRDDALSDRERALFGEILHRLVHDVELSLRRHLAERLAGRADAPHGLVVALANDAIEVARSILVRSEILGDAELIEIVRHRTLEHQLAIAMRRSVSEPVSDALIEEGAPDVIRTLLENPNAAISAAAMEYLVEQSKRIDAYQNPLLARPELSPALARRLYWWVSTALRERILARFEIDPATLDETLEQTVSALVPAAPAEPDNPRKNLELAARLAANGEITPRLLVQTLRQGEVALFEALFATLAKIRLALAGRLLFEPGGEGLAIACRAIGIEAPVFASIFVLSRRARPLDAPPLPGDVSRVIRFYNSLRRSDAEALLRKWRRQSEPTAAIRRLDERMRVDACG
jgi:uncharacterized protein (DUF2336 family)